VAKACGAGSECGRCRHTVRAIIEATAAPEPKRRKGFLHRG
jgi:bacterioferritin-associated ferredoxin